MRALLAAALLVLAASAHAVEPGERLPDPALEARARTIGAGLRCLVCQNESIDESGAELARDIRALVRRRLALGDNDAAVFQAVVDRYGDFVLLRPPVRRETWLLWFGPIGLLAVGLGGALLWLRRPAAAVTEPALTAEEQRRLADLMQEDQG